MSLFGLDPQSLAARHAAGAHVPTPAESLLRGAAGFTLVSLGGFAPWIFAGGWFHRHGGDAALYPTCAAAFVALSGLLLHRLILGTGTLGRCYKVFALAFLAYAVVWCAAWFGVRGRAGEWAGSALGSAAFAGVLAMAFGSPRAFIAAAVALFLLHSAGYFAGGWAYATLGARTELFGAALDRATRAMLARTAWGLFYGLGFGAGIGLAFHSCQAPARELIRLRDAAATSPNP